METKPANEVKVTSRRALLASITAGVAAAVAGTLARATPVAGGATVEYVQLGSINIADEGTQINTSATDQHAFWGKSGAGPALMATATSGSGVLAISETGTGVAGSTTSGTAGDFISSSGKGVVAGSSSDNGLWASSYGKSAVWAQSQAEEDAAVFGWAVEDTTGITGHSGLTAFPSIPKKTGVYGHAAQDASAVGVRGTSPLGRGGVFKGGAAQIRLTPSINTSHPASGQKGDLYVDSTGRLWFCKGGTTWVRIA